MSLGKGEKLFSKFDLSEGGSFSILLFNSDIQLTVFSCSCFMSVCPFVALLKAKFAEHLHTVLSCPQYKGFLFSLECVLS